ncbi:MAG: response regulator [Oligoflexia bacterium]|nr:response regulator [Oligoflexia bacterium]
MDKKWILVIEDDLDLLKGIAEILKRKNFTPVTANNYKEATLKLKKQKFNCIVTDLKLTAGSSSEAESGASLVEYIRSQIKDENHSTPIFVISGNIDNEAVARLKGKIQGALVKPFTVDELVEKIKAIAA